MAELDVNILSIKKEDATFTLDASNCITGITASNNQLNLTKKDGTSSTVNIPANTAGASKVVGTRIYLIGATSQEEVGETNGVQTYSSSLLYFDADNQLKVSGRQVLTQHQDISGKADRTVVISPSSAVTIPEEGAANATRFNMTGITADHVLVRWNFSSSAENNPPVSLQWTTGSGYFEITNLSGTTSETIQPVFALPNQISTTVNNS